MGLYRLRGRLTQLGQCQFDNETIIYAYVEIVGADGSRSLVKRVAVCTDVSSGLHEGMEGEFYFDKLFVFGRSIYCQLWGFETAERRIVDSVNMRSAVTRGNLIFGILFTPVLAIGSTHLVAGLGQLAILLTGSVSRRKFLRSLEAATARSTGSEIATDADSSRYAGAHRLHTQVYPNEQMVRR
jgi:hypothetical protein